MNSRKFVTVFCILLSTAFLFANDPQDKNESASKFYKNKISYRFHSSSLSYYRVINSKSNIRFKVDIEGSMGKSKDERESRYESNGEIQNTTGEATYDNDGQYFGLLMQYLRYFKKSKEINFYFSIGPSFSIDRYVYSGERSETNEGTENDDKSFNTHNTNSISLGTTATLGFEINLSSRIGVYGAYDLNYYYFWTDYESETEHEDSYKNTNTETENGWDLGISGFQFGVFINF